MVGARGWGCVGTVKSEHKKIKGSNLIQLGPENRASGGRHAWPPNQLGFYWLSRVEVSFEFVWMRRNGGTLWIYNTEYNTNIHKLGKIKVYCLFCAKRAPASIPNEHDGQYDFEWDSKLS